MSASPSLAVGSTFGGDYKVVRALHEGAERAVYAVEQLSTGKPLALKVISPSLAPDDESRRRFVEEVRVGGRINSPHLVDVRAAGVEAGLPFVVMELLEGEDLGTALRKSDQKPPMAAWDEVLSQLLRGLSAVHAAGVAHGALTPSSIFLAREPGAADGFRLQLIDLGVPTLGRSAPASEAERLPFLAPERASGAAAATPAMDVWAAAMIAFRMLAGRNYFRAAAGASPDASALSAEIAQGATEAASARAKALGSPAQLPASFDAWFKRCTAREPSARFADAAEALEGATDLLAEASAVGAEAEDVADEPEPPQPSVQGRAKPPPLPPMMRAIAENPKPAFVAIGLLVALALAGGFGLGALRGGPKNQAADGARARAASWALKGVDACQKACDGGEGAACAGLANIYLGGQKAPRDEAKAAQLFEQGCGKGDMPSCGALAQQYLNGDGVEKDAAKAVGFYRKACDGGDNLSCADLADMYQNGNGVPKDEAQARALLDKACKAGYSEVCK